MTKTTKTSEAAARRLHAARRAALIAALGFAPEPKNCPAGDRYAATSGEMWSWLAQDKGVEFANAVLESA